MNSAIDRKLVQNDCMDYYESTALAVSKPLYFSTFLMELQFSAYNKGKQKGKGVLQFY